MAVAQDLERYLIRIDATTEQLRRELRLGETAVASTARNIDSSTDKIAKSFDTLNGRLSFTRNLLGGLTLGAAAREIVEYADTWRQLEGRLKIVSRDMTEVQGRQEALFDVAQRSRAPLEATTQLYTRITQALNEQQRAQFDVLTVTETFAKGLAITGESAASAQGAVVQFTQALAGDFKASAQELNSLNEQAPRVAKAIADALGTTTAGLKQLAKDGKLSTETVLDALMRASSTIEAEYAQMPTTVGGALTRLDNAFLKFVGHNDLVMEGTGSLAASINSLADNFDVVAKTVQVAGAATALYYTPAMVTATAASVSGAAASLGFNLAVGRMAGYSIAASTSLLTLAAAGRVVMAAFPYATLAAAAYGLYEIADGSDAAAAAEQRYASELSKLSGLQNEYINASKERRDEIRKHIEDNIVSYEAERQVFINMMQDYLKMSKIRLGAEELLGRARNEIFAPISDALGDPMGGLDYKATPSQIAAGLEGTTKNIDALNNSLDQLGKSKGSVSAAGAEISKLGKKQSDWSEQLKISVEQAKRLNAASRESEAAYKSVALQIDVENDLREKGYKIGSKVYEARKQELTQLKQLEAQTESNLDAIREEQKKREQMAEEMARQFAQPFENAAENIQSTLADTFEGVFDGSIDSAGDAADAIKKIFVRTFAEIAALAIFRPSVFASGGIGAAAGAIFGGAGSIGAGGSIGGASSASGLGLGDLSSVGSFLANGSLYSSTLGGWGYSLGSMFDPAGLVGPSFYGNIGAGALGNMGYGALGGIAANLLGLGGGVGGMVGGTLGSLAGGAMGTSLGTILGLPGGPLGAIAGSFIGTALGGLFGGKSVPSRYVGAYVGMGEDGKFTPGTFGSDEATQDQIDAYKQLQQSAADGLNNISSILGVTLKSAPKLQFSTSGKRDGGKIRVGIQGMGNDVLGPGIKDMLTQEAFTDGEKALEYALRMVMANADFEGVSDKMEGYFKKAFTANASVEDALNDIAKVKALFAETETPLSAAEEAMKALNETFDDYSKTAQRLGFSVADLAFLESERAEKLKELRDGYNGEILNQIRSMVDPVGLAVDQEMKRYQAQLKEAQAIGADTAQVETLHQLQLQAIYGQQASEVAKLAENFKRMSAQLQQTKDDLLIGSLSTLNPQQQYDMLAAKFEDIGTRARLGDTEALAALSGISKEFLEVSRSMFGSTDAYATDFAHVLDIIDLAQDTSDRQIEIQEEILDGQQEIAAALATVADIIASGGNAQAGLLVEVNNKLALLNDRISRSLAA